MSNTVFTQHRIHTFRSFALEWIIVLFVWLLFIAQTAPVDEIPIVERLEVTPIITTLIDPTIRLSALEHERLVGSLLPAWIGLWRYSHIPTWNPYINLGVPTINNGFNYLFNPAHSLPVLLLGPESGSKLTIAIALLIAAYGMWTLTCAIGLGALARITAACLYMMSGGILSKYFGGHFQLGNSLAWPPFVFAAFWWTVRSPYWLAPVGVGVGFALLFYAGNIYYTLHTGICCFVIAALHLVEARGHHWRFRGDRLKRVIWSATFAFGLSALQFFPVWETRAFVSHEVQTFNNDGSLGRSYGLGQAAVNLIYPWDEWFSLQAEDFKGLIASVDYAYIGPTVFVLIAFALVGLRYSRQLPEGISTAIVISLLLAGLMMIWGAGQTRLLSWAYMNVPLLLEFRFLGRTLAIAGLWWIMLAGICVDVIWNIACDHADRAAHWGRHDRARLLRAAFVAVVIWGFLLIYSLSDPAVRSILTLNNSGLRVLLDNLILTSFTRVTEILALLFLVTLSVDAVLFILQYAFLSWVSGFDGRVFTNRLIRRALLTLIVYAMLDIMLVNNHILRFDQVTINLGEIYAEIRNRDDAPFPATNLPFSSRAFDAYEAEIRNWGLNEGWRPKSPDGVVENGYGLRELPRWSIEYQNETTTLAQAFNYQLIDTYLVGTNHPGPDSPDISVNARLYESEDALPYAFVVSAELLTNNALNLVRRDVNPAHVISHTQDTIHVLAEAPDNPLHFLVIQETNFPGWQVTADGLPLQVTTAESYYGARPQGFVAVSMLAGEHTYTLRFEPPGLKSGLVVFCATLALIGFYASNRTKAKSPR
jgi:hypothetical protein